MLQSQRGSVGVGEANWLDAPTVPYTARSQSAIVKFMFVTVAQKTDLHVVLIKSYLCAIRCFIFVVVHYTFLFLYINARSMEGDFEW